MHKHLKPLIFIVFTLLIIGCVNSAKAENAIVNCHGCSYVQERNTARNKIMSAGFVWVFNGPANSVRKFEILDDTLGDGGSTRIAIERSVDPILKTKYQTYVSAMQVAGAANTIVLPPGHPVDSVALVTSPSNRQWASQAISQHINGLGWGTTWRYTFSDLVDRIESTIGIQGNDVSASNGNTVYTVIFQDLSSAYFTINVEDHGVTTELKANFTGDAFDAEGNPVPTGNFGWDGVSWADSAGANAAWQSYGSEIGLLFSIGSGGASCTAFMLCTGDAQTTTVTCMRYCP